MVVPQFVSCRGKLIVSMSYCSTLSQLPGQPARLSRLTRQSDLLQLVKFPWQMNFVIRTPCLRFVWFATSSLCVMWLLLESSVIVICKQCNLYRVVILSHDALYHQEKRWGRLQMYNDPLNLSQVSLFWETFMFNLFGIWEFKPKWSLEVPVCLLNRTVKVFV